MHFLGDISEANFYSTDLSAFKSPTQHITLEPHSSDMYVISTDIGEDGIYEIRFRIQYTYMGKSYSIKSDKVRFVYLNDVLDY